MSQQRREVWFSGRVQGVGFRYTTHSIAAGFSVTGFVKNLADGRVLLVVEGEKREIGRFIEAIQDRMASNIDDLDESVMESTDEFRAFDIRH